MPECNKNIFVFVSSSLNFICSKHFSSMKMAFFILLISRHILRVHQNFGFDAPSLGLYKYHFTYTLPLFLKQLLALPY